MIYDIKAHPTKYAGTMFRSRLEARWAAFFDLARLRWVYEPFDLNGWTPDFLLRTSVGDVLAEVKPVTLEKATWKRMAERFYNKALDARYDHWVLLLGVSPTPYPAVGIGVVWNDWCSQGGPEVRIAIKEGLRVKDSDELWNQANNRVQRKPVA